MDDELEVRNSMNRIVASLKDAGVFGATVSRSDDELVIQLKQNPELTAQVMAELLETLATYPAPNEIESKDQGMVRFWWD